MLDNQIPNITNEFGFHFLNSLSEQTTHNVAFSPWSMINTLGVLLVGSTFKSPTQLELYDVLKFRKVGTDMAFHEMILDLREKIRKSAYRRGRDSDDSLQLWMVSYLLYNSEKVKLYKRFRQALNQYYDTEIDNFYEQDDIRGKLHVRINRWVENASNSKIKFFDYYDSNEMKQMMSIFVDAFYFKGKWLYDFELTTLRFFYNNGRIPSPTYTEFYSFRLPKMIEYAEFSQKDYYVHGSNESEGLDCRVFALPYKHKKGKIFSAVFLLPNKPENIEQLQRKLNNQAIVHIYQSLKLQDAYVAMPRVSVDTLHSAEATLNKMGLKSLFMVGDNFDLMYEKAPKIGYSSMKQRAKIVMDAEGVEVVGSSRAADIGPLNFREVVLPYLNLNRPFLFIIRHNPTNTSLMIGRVSRL